MSVVKKNIIANFLGRGLSALLSIVFVPFYLKYLGAESYGLVGLFATLQSVFMFADMGLSGTFTREIARLSVMEDGAQQMRDLCRTFEGIFVAIGMLTSFIIAILSRSIAENWVNLEQLSVATASSTILFIGLAVGLQFPFFIYQGGMQGLQRQSLLNVLLLGLGFCRGLGAVLILKFVDPSIQTFFTWQVVISATQLSLGHFMVWRSLPPTFIPPRFNINLIRPLWRFAAGTAGITLTGILLSQVDKVILTKMLSLEKFGYYTLAGVVASVPGMVALPFNSAIYPRFTQLVAMGNFSELAEIYHRSCQFLNFALLPMGLVLAFFSKETMLLWTGSVVTAQNTFQLVTVLVVGTTMMGLMIIPFSLQLAFAWTKLSLYFNIAAFVIIAPLLMLLVSRFGALGACFVWVALYTGQITVMIQLMHRYILKDEKLKWYINDIGKPLISSLVVISIGRLFIYETMSKPILITNLILISTLAVFVSAMSTPLVRRFIFEKIITLTSNLRIS